MELVSILANKGGSYVAVGLIATILTTALFTVLKYVMGEERDKRNNTETKVDNTEAKVHELELKLDAKIAEAASSATNQIATAERRINARIDTVESKVGGIVTGDIAQLYREITTLQGDIKVLASELKNLNSNIKTLFDGMSSDIRNTIIAALTTNK